LAGNYDPLSVLYKARFDVTRLEVAAFLRERLRIAMVSVMA
jgi:hypothetical protein